MSVKAGAAKAARRAPVSPGSQSAAAFGPIRSTRASDEIAAQIRRELAEGRLRIGSRLPSERALAVQFGVSRNTLRGALRSLEHSGLIRLQMGATGGAFISEHSGEAIITGLLDLYHLGIIKPTQLTDARIWFESIAVRQACLRATRKDIAELESNIEAAAAAHAKGDFAGRSSLHLDFHRILAKATGNHIMEIVLNGILDVMQHFIKTLGSYENSYVLPSRRRFMKHFVAGDADRAVAEMESNLKRLRRTYFSRIRVNRLVSAHGETPAVERIEFDGSSRGSRPGNRQSSIKR